MVDPKPIIDLGALGARAAVLAPARPFPTTFLGFLSWLGVTPTPGQRVLCAVAYDGVEPRDLSPEDKVIALKIFGPVDTIPKGARGTLAVVAGARSGKSYVLIGLHMVWAALTVDLKTLAPGQKAVALVVAVNIKLRNEVIAYAYGACLSKPELKAALFVSKGKKEEHAADSFGIRRPDGRIVMLEAGIAGRGGYGARGRSLVSAYLDEGAFFRAEGQACDTDIYTAASPRVLPGGITVVASTPWHEAGLLYEMWAKNHGKPTTCLVAHAPTSVMQDNDFTRDLIQRERLRDPENASREFDAEFVKSGTSIFFDPALIEASIDKTINWEAA